MPNAKSASEERQVARKAAQEAAEAERRARAREKEQRQEAKAAKVAEAASKKAEKAAEAAAKKAEKAAEAERRHTEQRERQEQREREHEEAELEAMLCRIPPSVLNGSTDESSFRVLGGWERGWEAGGGASRGPTGGRGPRLGGAGQLSGWGVGWTREGVCARPGGALRVVRTSACASSMLRFVSVGPPMVKLIIMFVCSARQRARH